MIVSDEKRTLRNWCDLPQQILQLITQHLFDQHNYKTNKINLVNFGCVCRKWRQSTTISSFLPNPITLPCTPTHQILSSTTVHLIHRPNTTPWIFTTTTMGSTQLSHPLTGTPFHNLPENLDFQRFRPLKLAVTHHVAPSNGKSVVCSSFRSVYDISVFTLYDGGHLCGYKYEHGNEPKWVSLTGLPYKFVGKIDDLVLFRGTVYVVDRRGKLYRLEVDECNSFIKVTNIVESERKSYFGRNRKRLVVSSKELFLVDSGDVWSQGLNVYRLKRYRSRRLLDWVMAQDLGNDVLFVTRDHCFFVPDSEFSHCSVSVSDCIVFSLNAFPNYITNGWEFREGDEKFSSVHRLTRGIARWCLSYSSIVWSPMSCYSHSDLLWEFEKDEKGQFDLSSKGEDEEGKSDSSTEEEDEELQASSNSQERTAGTPVVDDASNVTEEDIPKEKVAHSTSGIPSAYEASEICNTKTNFQGIDITSLLMPTLETIRAKHGNLIDEAVVRNKGMLACALELLASMVITLQNSTAKTLTDAVAEELRSNLADLQYVGLKVDWLVPTVTKVLALQKSKPLIKSIMSLEKAKAEVDEREREFLAESAKKKQELEESRADLFARIPLTEPIDLDECLGIGI